MDTVGKKGARFEIAAIKVVAARLATTVIDRAIQLFGGAGVSDDWPLAEMYTHARTLHLVDGPDEVHMQQIARRELRQYETSACAERRHEGPDRVRARATRGLASTAARGFGELVDALEDTASTRSGCSERVSGRRARSGGRALVRGRAHDASSSSARACRCSRAEPGAARQGVGQPRRALGRPRAPGLRARRRRARPSSRRSASPARTAPRSSTRRCRSSAASGPRTSVDHDGPRFHYEGVSIGTAAGPAAARRVARRPGAGGAAPGRPARRRLARELLHAGDGARRAA